MSRSRSYELLNISEQQLEDIRFRVDTNSLSAEDIKLLKTLLTTYTWLMKQLARSKITLHRLKQIFGYSSEKKNRLKNSNPDAITESEVTESTPSTVAVAAVEEVSSKLEATELKSKTGVPPKNK